MPAWLSETCCPVTLLIFPSPLFFWILMSFLSNLNSKILYYSHSLAYSLNKCVPFSLLCRYLAKAQSRGVRAAYSARISFFCSLFQTAIVNLIVTPHASNTTPLLSQVINLIPFSRRNLKQQRKCPGTPTTLFPSLSASDFICFAYPHIFDQSLYAPLLGWPLSCAVFHPLSPVKDIISNSSLKQSSMDHSYKHIHML